MHGQLNLKNQPDCHNQRLWMSQHCQKWSSKRDSILWFKWQVSHVTAACDRTSHAATSRIMHALHAIFLSVQLSGLLTWLTPVTSPLCVCTWFCCELLFRIGQCLLRGTNCMQLQFSPYCVLVTQCVQFDLISSTATPFALNWLDLIFQTIRLNFSQQ